MLLALLLLAPVDTVQVRDIRLGPDETVRTTIVGAGRPVVFVPGIMSSAYAFRKVIPTLQEEGLQVVVIEPLGAGFSSRPENADYSLTAQADRIAKVMDTLGIRGAPLVGHALGVSMVLRLALRRPELVSHILAMNGGPAETAATSGVRRAVKFAFLIKLFGGQGLARQEVVKSLRKTAGDDTWITREVIEQYTAGPGGDLHAVLRAMKGMARAREPDSLAPRLGEIALPVRLLIGGAPRGSGIPARQTALLRERLPKLVVDTIPGAGLHIHEEQPGVVVRALLDLISPD
ncbi:MAG TPA: alpha/beta hydrolase [Gemmatimonadales bacterium]